MGGSGRRQTNFAPQVAFDMLSNTQYSYEQKLEIIASTFEMMQHDVDNISEVIS